MGCVTFLLTLSDLTLFTLVLNITFPLLGILHVVPLGPPMESLLTHQNPSVEKQFLHPSEN